MGSLDVQVGVLGALEVRSNGNPVAIPGQRPSIVLASLAISAGRPVSQQVLAEHVWGERPPVSSKGSLHSLVMRLRRAVGSPTIRTTPTGYLLDIDPVKVDLLRFRRLADQADHGEDAAEAQSSLREALGLWRGEPLAGLESEALARHVVPGLVEERLTALERRIGLDMAAGQHGGLVPELRELVSRYPLRESLWRQLITAQDLTGRRADALGTYHRLRAELRESLGIEPSGDLQDLYRRLLVEPAGTEVPAPGARTEVRASPPVCVTTTGPAGTARNELPGDIADFTGRTRELERLIPAVAPALGDAARTVRICAIDAMAGAGKTTLAVHLAHLLADDFPDGQLCVDLHAHTCGREPLEPADALEHLLRAIGVPADAMPDGLAQRAALWRAELAGRRVLVLLDDAATAAQVRPLIPGAAGCLAIVTSRRYLADLDGALVETLGILPEADALALFTAVVGAERTADEPAAVAEVLRLCGYLPLAVRIAAVRLRARPAWRIRDLVLRLTAGQRRLAELTVGGRGVSAAFAMSYQRLPAAHQRMFRLLGLFPGVCFDAVAAAALADAGAREAEVILEDLLDAHLLSQPGPDRYQFHDLVREHARETVCRVESPRTREMAARRLLNHYQLSPGGSRHAGSSPPVRLRG
jgi:DNA-binding SARP family transcriptional activator